MLPVFMNFILSNSSPQNKNLCYFVKFDEVYVLCMILISRIYGGIFYLNDILLLIYRNLNNLPISAVLSLFGALNIIIYFIITDI
jgi:hypothetical protein